MTAGAVGSFIGTPAEISLIRMTSDGRYCFPLKFMIVILQVWNPEKLHTLIGCCPVHFFTIQTAHLDCSSGLLIWTAHISITI